MAVSERKLKTLRVMQILLEMSDDEHGLTAADIVEELGKYGLTAERRSVYDDIDVLKQFGVDIIKEPGNRGWHVGARELELSELKILIDAVQVARFIPEKKSEELIRKLEKLTSRHLAKKLHRQILLSDPAKGECQTIYNYVDIIHEAMSQNHQMRFQYTEWTVKKTRDLRHDGEFYQVSPWGLLWDDEYYYLLAYDPAINDIKHYRVDRMQKVEEVMSKREGDVIYRNYQKGFSKKTFGMYGGVDVSVKLRCANCMAPVLIDRFGLDVMMVPKDDGYFTAHILITSSPQFFGWVASNGSAVEILEPQSLREEYAAFLKGILQRYP